MNRRWRDEIAMKAGLSSFEEREVLSFDWTHSSQAFTERQPENHQSFPLGREIANNFKYGRITRPVNVAHCAKSIFFSHADAKLADE